MNKNRKLIPELRFPEFRDDGEWNMEPLGNLSDEIVEKTKGRKYKLMSITSGVGLVSQIEKFGREIAGDSYKNYYVINQGDFAYNKSSTKLYGEGEIAMYEDKEIGAVPNSIFTCFRFRHNKIYPLFAKYPFINNIHGNWLKKFIAVGARANGALQVNVQDLFSLPFPYPTMQEQQKIASCLSSLDDLITAHTQKLELLKDHKKGLMQNLFPQEGEKVPKLRFKEFEKDGEWEEKKLGDMAELTSSKRVHLADYVSSGIPFFRGKEISQLKSNQFPDNILYISHEQYNEINEKYGVPQKGDILITAVGTLGNVYRIKNDNEFYFKDGNLIWMRNILIEPDFLEVLLDVGKKKVLGSAIGSSQKALTMAALNKLVFQIPIITKEQQKIASCLSSLDELIIAQTEKIEQLKQHKKGLMQGLFPNVKTGHTLSH